MKVWAMNVSGMTVSGGRRFPALVFSMILSVIASSTGWAQIGGGAGGGGASRGGHAQDPPDKPPEPAPDPIPGSKPKQPVAPATKPIGDMQPTDALFDAINRGDVAAARDALNRGADMNGVNILGMTPMELSVDLGRNDISFLLLSMRGEDTNRGSRALGRDSALSAPPSKTAHAAKPAGPSKTGPGRAAQMANTPVASRPVATPKLLANDGGTPLPSAGFLGFDSRSASN